MQQKRRRPNHIHPTNKQRRPRHPPSTHPQCRRINRIRPKPRIHQGKPNRPPSSLPPDKTPQKTQEKALESSTGHTIEFTSLLPSLPPQTATSTSSTDAKEPTETNAEIRFVTYRNNLNKIAYSAYFHKDQAYDGWEIDIIKKGNDIILEIVGKTFLFVSFCFCFFEKCDFASVPPFFSLLCIYIYTQQRTRKAVIKWNKP